MKKLSTLSFLLVYSTIHLTAQVINIPADKKSQMDSKPIRSAAVQQGVTYITTLEGARAAISGMDSLERTGFSVKPIQEYIDSSPGRDRRYRHDIDIRKSLWN